MATIKPSASPNPSPNGAKAIDRAAMFLRLATLCFHTGFEEEEEEDERVSNALTTPESCAETMMWHRGSTITSFVHSPEISFIPNTLISERFSMSWKHNRAVDVRSHSTVL